LSPPREGGNLRPADIKKLSKLVVPTSQGKVAATMARMEWQKPEVRRSDGPKGEADSRDEGGEPPFLQIEGSMIFHCFGYCKTSPEQKVSKRFVYYFIVLSI